MDTNIQPIEDKPEIQSGVRPDLREPTVSFGRCCITGEWGKVLNLDPGDMNLRAPVIDDPSKIEYDPSTGQVTFLEWEEKVIQTNISVSPDGLRKMLAYVEDQDNPIPAITPLSLYAWQVLYSDGGAIQQFEGATEHHLGDVDLDRVAQMTVAPTMDADLPTYTFVRESGKFYRNGVEIDTEYEHPYDPTAELYYGRKVTHTFGSAMDTNGLTRSIQGVHSSVLQLLGWYTGGPREIVDTQQNKGRGFVLAIDERGNHRGWWENS